MNAEIGAYQDDLDAPVEGEPDSEPVWAESPQAPRPTRPRAAGPIAA